MKKCYKVCAIANDYGAHLFDFSPDEVYNTKEEALKYIESRGGWQFFIIEVYVKESDAKRV